MPQRSTDQSHTCIAPLGVRVFIACVAICGGASASAQEFGSPFAAAFLENSTGENSGEGEQEHLETDRDSFTPATTLVGRDRLMIETSYSFIDNRSVADGHSFPELLLRYGLTDWFEIRLGWNYEIGGGDDVTGVDFGEEFEPVGLEKESSAIYGFKVAVSEQDRWVPQSAIIMHADTPTSGAITATDFVAAYVFGWTLPNEWNLSSSLRYAFANDEGDQFNEWAPSAALKVPVGEQWNVHAEYFGIFSDNADNETNPQYASPGVHYLVTPDVEVGVRVGWGLNDDADAFFANVGLGVRF